MRSRWMGVTPLTEAMWRSAACPWPWISPIAIIPCWRPRDAIRSVTCCSVGMRESLLPACELAEDRCGLRTRSGLWNTIESAGVLQIYTPLTAYYMARTTANVGWDRGADRLGRIVAL